MEDSDVLLLHAAADPTRLAILRELSKETSVCACDFTGCCGTIAQPTVSHHLKVLRGAGWVSAERHGAKISYWIRAEAVDRFRHLADELRPGSHLAVGELSLRVLGSNSEPTRGKVASHSLGRQ